MITEIVIISICIILTFVILFSLRFIIKYIFAEKLIRLQEETTQIDKRRKMERQGLIVSIKQLKKLIKELEAEEVIGLEEKKRENLLFQINIINKERLSDTWKIE